MVVLRQARAWRPRRPAAFIRRQTRLRATRWPRTTSSAHTPRSPRTSRLFFREPGRYFFCEITLHSQDCVLLAETFQLSPLGLGQLLVLTRVPLFGFAHPLA